ncbi:MAG: hypothetical protein CL512_05550 [Actinobacteria bacterium]|nr:hypothetical protein [Actinomycetota bacterium]|tara:strand:+ start:536 stop:1375 length:840 start_codon:yes stop_codon:yes gene_type:complete
MALMFAIDSFHGWDNTEQKQAFIKHLLGDTAMESLGSPTSSFDNMTIKQLKEECKSKGIKGITQKSKAELVELLKRGPQAKTKKDKTKEVVLDKNFYKAEFAEKFNKDPSTIKVSELKKAVGKKGFDIANQLPPVERKDGKIMENTAFGAKKENMIDILTSHLESVDMEALKAEDAEKKSGQVMDSSSEEEVAEEKPVMELADSSDEESAVEVPKKKKKPVTETADSSEDEPLSAVAAKAKAVSSDTKKKRRSKARRKDVADLPSEEFEPAAEDFHAED